MEELGQGILIPKAASPIITCWQIMLIEHLVRALLVVTTLHYNPLKICCYLLCRDEKTDAHSLSKIPQTLQLIHGKFTANTLDWNLGSLTPGLLSTLLDAQTPHHNRTKAKDLGA